MLQSLSLAEPEVISRAKPRFMSKVPDSLLGEQ